MRHRPPSALTPWLGRVFRRRFEAFTAALLLAGCGIVDGREREGADRAGSGAAAVVAAPRPPCEPTVAEVQTDGCRRDREHVSLVVRPVDYSALEHVAVCGWGETWADVSAIVMSTNPPELQRRMPRVAWLRVRCPPFVREGFCLSVGVPALRLEDVLYETDGLRRMRLPLLVTSPSRFIACPPENREMVEEREESRRTVSDRGRETVAERAGESRPTANGRGPESRLRRAGTAAALSAPGRGAGW